MASMTTPRSTRRQFLRSTALTAGAAAALSFPAPAFAQRPRLVYWCYQFLKSSDDARANFAREWAKKNNVDLQLSMVPWKEFMPKITAAIEAKATPDIVESGGVELRGRGQLLDVTDVYQKLEKSLRGLGGLRAQVHAGAGRAGPSHPLRLPGLHADRAGRPARAGGSQGSRRRPGPTCSRTPRRPSSPRGASGSGSP